MGQGAMARAAGVKEYVPYAVACVCVRLLLSGRVEGRRVFARNRMQILKQATNKFQVDSVCECIHV